ncbi:MAG: ABC transporter permease [Clostridium sp.]
MRIVSIVKRIIIQTLRDRRTLGLIICAPILLITLINYLLTSTTSDDIRIGVVDLPLNIQSSLIENGIDLVEYNGINNINKIIKDDNLDAYIYINDGKYNITYENSVPMDASLIKNVFINSLAKVRGEELTREINNVRPNLNVGKLELDIISNYIYGDENLSFFDTLNPTLIGFFVFFFVFIIAGVSILKEKTSKTLEKLLSTSIKKYEILLGYLLGYGVFGIIQTILVVLYSIYILDMKVAGSISMVILTNVLIAFVALSLGIFFSTFASSEFQLMQFIPITIVPQLFFTGIIPVDTMSESLQNIAHFIPLYYGADVLQKVMIKGEGFKDIYVGLIILLGFLVVIYIMNIVSLRKYRKI